MNRRLLLLREKLKRKAQLPLKNGVKSLKVEDKHISHFHLFFLVAGVGFEPTTSGL